MYKFSTKLRDECRDYFFNVHELKINHEEADEYLRSLAGLCSALVDIH